MDVQNIIESVGYIGVFLSVFLESGVIIAVVLPLPGFSLMFTAGVFAATGGMNLLILIPVALAAAILGYIVGYFTGYKYGYKMFSGKHHKYFTPQQYKKVKKFMNQYGYLTLIFGRFLPFIHTAAPILSGMAKTPFHGFMIANVVGGTAWVLFATLLGYFAGNSIPHAEYMAIPVILLISIIFSTPPGKKLVRMITRKFDNV